MISLKVVTDLVHSTLRHLPMTVVFQVEYPKRLRANLSEYLSVTFLCECDSRNSSVDYHVIRYRLKLEISDETTKVVIVMFDETTRVLLKCSANSILDCKGQDEEASLGLPTALANIVGTSHTLELKSHTYYEHGTSLDPPWSELELHLSGDEDLRCD
ncbi:ATP-dependent DNA helicase PIF1-like protein [Tanacetum coccineum]